MQNEELNKVKARIKALTEKTVSAGCTEQEAQSAMEKVGELLTLYNLTMNDIDIRDERFVTVKCETGTTRRSGGYGSIANALAHFCHCKVWFNTGVGTYSFFGMEPDTEMVTYLWKVIRSALTTELLAYKIRVGRQDRGQKKMLTTDFQDGFANRIYERLRTLREEQDLIIASQQVTGTSLMVIKDQLVIQEFEKIGMRLRKHYTYKRSYTTEGYGHGRAAGEKVNLSRPIGSEGRNKLRLK